MSDTIRTKIIELPEFERVFRDNGAGWLGSDNALSLPLSHDRVLWLFGDTFINEHFDDALPRERAVLINSSIALQRGKLLENNSLRFYWKRKSGRHRSFFESGTRPGFIWPLSAILHEGALHVAAVRIEHPDPTVAFGFIQTGNEFFRIENPEEDPQRWRMRSAALPFRRHGISFGSFMLQAENYIYLYGYRKSKGGWTDDIVLHIARAPLEGDGDLADQTTWEYLRGNTGTWSPKIQESFPALAQSRTEFSVTFMPKFNKYVYLANHWQYPNPVSIRLSDTPYGPFSEPIVVYECPETNYSENYFCYAAKAHPELSESDNDLVLTYMTNSKNLHECVADMRIYYPRFLRLIINL